MDRSSVRRPTRLRWAKACVASAVLLASAGAEAQTISVSGYSNYCSKTWASGAWVLFFGSGDPCANIDKKYGTGGATQRRGLYSTNSANRVVARCTPNYVWIYEGNGDAPLKSAFDVASGKLSCIFTVAPRVMPIFNAPFSVNKVLNGGNGNGFDFARPPYGKLVPSDYGQPGSSAISVMDWKGRDKTGYIDNHDGHDWGLNTGEEIKAVADGKVVMIREWDSGCTGNGSTSQYMKHVELSHTVCGTSGYCEQFVTDYGHLSAFAPGLKIDDNVKQGQKIGEAGSTGCSSGPHLHFLTARLTNTADKLTETLEFYSDSRHSNQTQMSIDPFGFEPNKNFDPWGWKAYPDGALSINLWKSGHAPPVGNW
jgi:murein DD-endopeptidase MepM/ murein hydrolase activator NlpD